MRALAVLLVVLYHLGAPFPAGFSGVDVFFVISGFVITGTLLPELEERGWIRLTRFYARRIRRLLPALALMIFVVASLGVLAAPAAAQRLGAMTGLFASLFAANAYLYHVNSGYFDVSTTLNPFLHTWTLAVEEQFYLFFPALLLLLWILGSRWLRLPNGARWSAFVGIAIVSLASFGLGLRWSAGEIGGRTAVQRLAFYGSPTRAWEFGAGAALAVATPAIVRIGRRAIAELLALAGLTLILVGAFVIHGTAHYPGRATLLPVVGTLALLAAGTIAVTGVSRALALSPAVWLGELSYGWYLWHWPAIVYAKALWPTVGAAASLAAVAALLAAWASFKWCENPIRSQWSLRPLAVFKPASFA